MPVKRRAGGALFESVCAKAMRELLRTNDPVEISWVTALLSDSGIATVVFDTNASVVEGSIGAIQRRIMVGDDDLARARRVLEDAGEVGSSG